MKTIVTRFGFGKKTIIIAVVVVVALGGIVYFFVARQSSSAYQFVSVARGSITQIVSVTGNTTPIQSLDLSFQSGGTVAAVYKNAGDTVSAGDILVTLDTSSLRAQLAQAQASVASAQANLQQLQAGPTPQATQVAQAAVATAQQSLLNSYSGIPNAVQDAYAKATDAVRNQIGAFYNNPDSANPQLSFSINDPGVTNSANTERNQTGQELNNWQNEITALSSAPSASSLSTSTLGQALKNAANHLSVIETMLNTDATAVVDETGLSASTIVSYQNAVAGAITEANTASSGINTIMQTIASQQAAVVQAQAQLSETLAGSTTDTIAAQQAQVAAAQANAQSIQVSIDKASLISPINGVVTTQNAKVGQVAAAGQTITSIISANNFEVDAYVPETDIGKVAVGNSVNMTFDAFPGETFAGKVFYIDPAETIQSGVVDYLIKVSFNTPDTRIKSGLTTNLDITTQVSANTLILPQFAIVQNVSGTYVDVLQNGSEKQMPVVLGIRDQSGNVEVTAGVTEGEQVINVGLKTP
jgi:RND family efflux transporter MFP subunit